MQNPIKMAAFVGAALLYACAISAETNTVVINEDYKEPPGGQRWLLGSKYRDLWATPVEIEVLDMSTAGGGLEPVMRVGGLQTPGLALKGADGRSYSFRATVKDPAAAIPVEFQGSGVEVIADDLMSSSIPGSDVLVPPFAEAVGVLHVEPRLVILPDDERLGEFREEFAGLVGTFMEYPTTGFAGSTAVLSPKEFLAARRAGPEGLVESRAYLRARLLDLLIGDWDRHHKQWRWARIPGLDGLQPIPEDRDQAFSAYDGLVMNSVRSQGAHMVNFRAKYPSIDQITRNGSDQDRLILTDISRDEWMAITDEVAAAVTDEVINKSIGRLPEAYRAQIGDFLFTSLQERRTGLAEFSAKYYDFLNRQVDVNATDRSESVNVVRHADGKVSVRIAVKEDEVSNEPYFERTFLPGDTKDVRIYLRDGADHVTVSGDANHAVRVRVIAGSEQDGVHDKIGNGVDRYDFADQPEPKKAAASRGGGQMRAIFSPNAVNIADTGPRDWGKISTPMSVLKYHKDSGLILGLGRVWEIYGFRKYPAAQRHTLRGGIAFGAGYGFVDYRGKFRTKNPKMHTELTLRVSGLDQLRYYGLGNETSSDLPEEAYQIDERRVTFFPAVATDLGGPGTLSLGLLFRHSDSSGTDEDTILAQENPVGFGKYTEAGIRLHYEFDNRKVLRALEPGLQWRAEAAVFPPVADVENTYGFIEADVGWHVAAGRPVLFSFFGGGKKIWRDFPYFEAAYLGAHANIKGYSWNRFAGDAMLYGGAHIRWSFATVRSWIPGEIGLVAGVEAGRVFLDGEDSRKWHPTYGAGFFFAPFDRLNAIEIGFAKGDEDTFFIIRSGIRLAG